MESPRDNPHGDMPADEFRKHGHAMVEWIARFMENAERYPVLARVAPGDIRSALPESAPEAAEDFEAIMADFDRVLVPGMTHWNHPGFMAYFAITASAPGVLADFVASALNQQAMLWRTSPSATELEAVVMGWLRGLIGLPDAFEGVIYDTASMSSLHAIAAAREAAVPQVRTRGWVRQPGPAPTAPPRAWPPSEPPNPRATAMCRDRQRLVRRLPRDVRPAPRQGSRIQSRICCRASGPTLLLRHRSLRRLVIRILARRFNARSHNQRRDTPARPVEP